MQNFGEVRWTMKSYFISTKDNIIFINQMQNID